MSFVNLLFSMFLELIIGDKNNPLEFDIKYSIVISEFD